MALTLDLRNCFPESLTGQKRGPLPKQAEFLRMASDANGPKYIRYCGGIGSGKSLVGCIQLLIWAVQYPGEYLIARQFMPELKTTTYKTFKEICPPELIIEDRIADMMIRVRSQGNKSSWVYFRGLEDADKLRSMNLSGFFIDESCQTSEAAFMLLQGRLRGPGLRKGVLTTNSDGHSWGWRWFIKKDMITSEVVKKQFANIYAPSTENIHLPTGYVETMLHTWSPERIQREIYADEDSFESQVYSEFRRDVHVIKPFSIPDTWLRYVGIDHGFRNPTAWVWGAVDYDGNIYIYREFYQREWLIEEVCKTGKEQLPSALSMMSIPGTKPTKWEHLEWAKIDPSTKARRNEREGVKLSDFDIYLEHLPSDFPLQTANNDVTAGIDKVKSYLKQDIKTGKPRLFIFSTCTNLIEEISTYRYPELTHSQQGKRSEKENPMKVNDHAVDSLRYLIMGIPDVPIADVDPYEKIKYSSLEGQLVRDLEAVRHPGKGKDPFGN